MLQALHSVPKLSKSRCVNVDVGTCLSRLNPDNFSKFPRLTIQGTIHTWWACIMVPCTTQRIAGVCKISGLRMRIQGLKTEVSKPQNLALSWLHHSRL